jgi:hypothetical protein
MFKSKVIYEGARTGLYTAGGARGCKGRQREMTVGAHWSPARSPVKAQPRCTQTRAKGRGRVEPGVDCWERARTPGVNAWDREGTLRTSTNAGAYASGANAG